jgi:hypothetical protein
MEHWQPIGVGIGALSVLWAAAARRPRLGLAGAGVAACFSAPEAAAGAWILLAAAAAPRLPAPVLAGVAAVGLYLVTPVLLGVEVFYTAVLVWGATVALGVGAVESVAEGISAR